MRLHLAAIILGRPFAVLSPQADLASRRRYHGAASRGRRCDIEEFKTLLLPDDPDVQAPDGLDVRVLLSLKGGSMAHFQLGAGLTSRAVAHRTVEELWYFIGGYGELWRRNEAGEETTAVREGVCISIPLGTAFQFRSFGPEPLSAVAITMPPWPGMDEAYEVEGKWQPQLNEA